MFQKKLETLQKYVRENLTLSRIKHFVTNADAFVLFVFKKNEELRLCVNYKNFNVITIKNRTSMFFINETLNRLINVAYLTKFDFKNVYHRIKIRKNDE